MNIPRPPDLVTIHTEDRELALGRTDGGDRWRAGSVEVATRIVEDELRVGLSAPDVPMKRIHLRWNVEQPSGVRVLGDEWERGYGGLQWRCLVPERMLPWTFIAFDGRLAWGCGVKTQPNAMCSWRVDSKGFSLWLDVRSGGVGVELADRCLDAAVVVVHEGASGDSPYQVSRSLCRKMCDAPLMPPAPVYGGNNWYYAYGNSSHEQILKDANLIASSAPDGGNRPFMVIDDGWQVQHGPGFNGGPWDAGNAKFPDMAGLSDAMKDIGTRPGIWIRPMWTRQTVPDTWLFAPNRIDHPHVPRTLDPTVPDVRELVATDIKRLVDWGYELIKHDFSTFDICGRWGFEMSREVTPDGWSFSRRDRTTAEVLLDFYRVIRAAAGDALILGCNTMGHLAAGLVELQRTGDDTSGIEWERTRQRGVNTLAFRMPQQGTFFSADADCVGLTSKVPWEMNRQWLDLVARSGTPLFVSASPEAVGPEQRQALKRAFAVSAQPQPPGEPLDWLDTTTPQRWLLNGEEVEYDWYGDGGVAFSFV